jgi:hypothetical protein
VSKRSEKMKTKSNGELVQIVKSGSLSAAAAEYELRNNRGIRSIGDVEKNK